MTHRILIAIGLLLTLCAVARAIPGERVSRRFYVSTSGTVHLKALMVVGILLVMIAVARAEERPLPKGTAVIVTLPTGERIAETLGEDYLLITAVTARSCVVAKRVRDVLRAALTDCIQSAEIAKPQPPSRFWQAVKYVSVGVGLAAVFYAGVAVGSR